MRRLFLIATLLLATLLYGCGGQQTAEEVNIIEEMPEKIEKTRLSISDLNFTRDSATAIHLEWSDKYADTVDTYLVMRSTLPATESSWIQIGEASDSSFTDYLSSIDPQQYLYRIDVKPTDPDSYCPEHGTEVVASNILVCIDPGHYAGSGKPIYGYEEGIFTLKIGFHLRDVLHEKYGIESRMTRDSDVITIDGYTNAVLDHNHLALRGEYSSGCDLFVSLHTNANLDNANGYDTLNQPINLTKTVVIVNRLASESNYALKQAAAVGREVSQVNYDSGISIINSFNETPIEWSDAYNDSLDTPGSICYRWQDGGEDYYGVLRGASSVGVPGFIIEHAHHTVPAVRDAALNSDICTKWAEADASGIAYGYGFSAH